MEFIEGEAPAFTLKQMILDLMDLCYYDGARGATKWCPATEGMMKELIEDIELVCGLLPKEEEIPVYPLSSAQRLELYDILEGSYTLAGFNKWLERPRPAFLDGKSPLQAITAGEYERVKKLAISCRDGAMGT